MFEWGALAWNAPAKRVPTVGTIPQSNKIERFWGQDGTN